MGEILIGVDGSEASLTALRWGAELAARSGASIRAVSAWSYPAVAGSPLGPSDLPDRATVQRQVQQQLAEIVSDELGEEAVHVEVEVGAGTAPTVLLDVAARDEVDFVVVGARGLGGFEGLLLGSVSQHCVEHATKPTVVLRGEAEPLSGRRIVVGHDGSAGGARALAWAIDLAHSVSAELVVVYAPGTGAAPDAVRRGHEALLQWCEPLADVGVPTELTTAPGDPRTAIADIAADVDAALIVVGSRGMGPVRGLLLGSVAGFLVRYVNRPIAVIPTAR